MADTFLSTPDELQWLGETHLKGVTISPVAVAILEGNDDCPDRILLYPVNDVRAEPTVYDRVDVDDTFEYHERH